MVVLEKDPTCLQGRVLWNVFDDVSTSQSSVMTEQKGSQDQSKRLRPCNFSPTPTSGWDICDSLGISQLS